MNKRKTLTLTLTVSAPKKMPAADIRKELRARINDYCGYFDAFSIGLPESDTDDAGGPRIVVKSVKAR